MAATQLRAAVPAAEVAAPLKGQAASTAVPAAEVAAPLEGQAASTASSVASRANAVVAAPFVPTALVVAASTASSADAVVDAVVDASTASSVASCANQQSSSRTHWRFANQAPPGPAVVAGPFVPTALVVAARPFLPPDGFAAPLLPLDPPCAFSCLALGLWLVCSTMRFAAAPSSPRALFLGQMSCAEKPGSPSSSCAHLCCKSRY